MDATPPQTLEDLARLVPDPSSAKAIVALVHRVMELEAELQKRDEVIKATHGFLRDTFRTSYDDFRRASRVGRTTLPVDSNSSSVAALTDHDELTSARSRDDFLEVCRRAFKIVEKTTYTYLSALRLSAPAELESVWDEQQASKEAATKGGKYPHSTIPLPQDWKTAFIADLIEVVFLLIYGDQYRRGTPATEASVRNGYFTLLTVRAARHPSSHGQEGSNSAEQSLQAIRSTPRRDEALKLYKTRQIDGYDRLVGPVFQYEHDALADIVARQSASTETPSSTTSGP